MGLEVKEKNNHWIVEKKYENGWASNQSIEEGNIVEFVDGKKTEEHSTVKRFNRVEMANSITIMDNKLKVHKFNISYGYMDPNFMFYLLFPMLFITVTILLSIFLYLKTRNNQSSTILIYFLLSIGICYLGASMSARGDLIGRLSTIITLPSSIILFTHFLKSYFKKYDLVFIQTKSLLRLYILYTIFLLTIAGNHLFYIINNFIIEFKLLYFSLLLSYLLFYIFSFYVKHKDSEGSTVIKILGMIIFLSFSPFVFFYAIPTIFLKNEFFPAEVTAIFLILIPIALVYLQLSEKLFDIEFFLNRLRYYSLISVPFTFLVVIILSFILNFKLLSSLTVMAFITLSICTTLFLYVKEYIDYKLRHHLFSPKGNFETSVYTFFQKSMYETKVSSLITNLKNEIKDVLVVKEVFYIEVIEGEDEENWGIKNRNNFPALIIEDVERIKWNHCSIGTLIQVMDRFAIVIGGDQSRKNIILFGMKKSKTNLNIQERIWLETLAYFSSILLENFQLIEDLFEKIKNYKEKMEIKNNSYPLWLSKLMFSLSEKERTNLSIDLHDSVLQDQLQLLRDIESITEQVTDSSIKNDLFILKERMLDNIHLVRETCNELRPPFLNELGVVQSIHNLIEQTKLRCTFLLISELDPSIQKLDKEVELTLYRVIQELLNNAMKHSLASKVEVSLRKNNQVLSLAYDDNGKGIDMAELDDSFNTMGIFGMKARVKNGGGTIEINSSQGQGMHVYIEFKEVHGVKKN
ncbi:sensor histidine kinase [Sporosarcina limicola]|uniref:Two-component system sensor histidine kinase ComP n=1 Tax=Sporosarcina limicola TaxID=34101 RepID=A0A927ML30_9BACL|nr:two-component system sensor histidine kinase ComP [Sporosarcina limicola]